jgi:hypothetical protein
MKTPPKPSLDYLTLERNLDQIFEIDRIAIFESSAVVDEYMIWLTYGELVAHYQNLVR